MALPVPAKPLFTDGGKVLEEMAKKFFQLFAVPFLSATDVRCFDGRHMMVRVSAG